MKRFIAIIGLVSLSVGIVSAKDLQTYRDTYTKSLETMALSHGKKVGKLNKQYSKSLNSVFFKVKKSDDADKAEVIEAELARFNKEKAMPENPSFLPEIKKLQTKYTKQENILELGVAKKIISLTTNYEIALQKFQKSLVANSKLDEAKEVQEERKSLKESEMYLQAIALLKSTKKTKKPATKKTKKVKIEEIEKELEIIPKKVRGYSISKVEEGQTVYSNSRIRLDDFPDELEDAYLVIRADKDAGAALSGEVRVTKKCTMYVALMWKYGRKIKLKESQFKLLERKGWELVDGGFSISSGGYWKVLKKEIPAGSVRFNSSGRPDIIVMFKEINKDEEVDLDEEIDQDGEIDKHEEVDD